uniref:Proteasome subunit beta n=1 Tax=Laticauda laticaudata TaxID=8630 RepID=A0A8C5SY68_LATLA
CRNAQLESEGGRKGLRLPAARKTGTTIAGVVYKDGIVLGADTRATEGMVVADKNCDKIHFIAPNIYCCGAGTAADTEMTTQMISSNMELHSLSTGRLPRVVTANRMLKQMLFRYQGYIGAALVLGGVDVTGPHLYSIYPHGSTDKLPYVTMGESHSCTTGLRCLHSEKFLFNAFFQPNGIKLMQETVENVAICLCVSLSLDPRIQLTFGLSFISLKCVAKSDHQENARKKLGNMIRNNISHLMMIG